MSNNMMDKIISLCKRRGFVFPGSEIYGGLANSWDYGPLGVELKNNIKQLWWKRFVHQRDDMVGIDAALIMNPKVWEASGHLKEFSDPLVECKKCHKRFRIDQVESKKCPECRGELSEAKQFNLMLKTFLGPVENEDSIVYFRPETAQAMFVDFKNVLETSRKKLPFGIAQIGKAFRNEITPGNFIFRTREFEQMEIEYFIKEENWEEVFEHWKKEMQSWMKNILGLQEKNISELSVPNKELAHYSKKTIDFEYNFPFGKNELYGLAYRTDFDLKNHYKEEPYLDIEKNEKLYPHVIEPTFGVDRSVLAVLCDAYIEEAERVVLKLKPVLAPYKVAVFPLLKNKPELVEKAKEIYNNLKKEFTVAFDDRGNIGKRYYSQDEIGTPYCVTVDFNTLEKDEVTVRDRDTMKQEKVKVSQLIDYIKEKIYV
ncbi:MAG: glycine--tRNA ligase [Candidatus Staskawiczbacteria bacterium RIFCSPHIGHO2_02_FULL_33_16]|uniref:Glycine--tRNA ligase n=1 Tax=Candidatus Staskawiczbacteria bacterium RIFCSPHIGHO2_02_FULL_33_16 TaxID=1802204 RepID=A0A1G2HU62_9BACT|nr:MAG: glycine--tRNA ligase [Candidatus Staskawiczbacteria bacterium RIFCSPHIGHO2_02_FULL_33_16]OGZ71003.1 MAG: glycine--tRNA ligase [Candidatus Staskawiczbacteria bacterium RIFCSPLOWO2_01_FULL_33_13]